MFLRLFEITVPGSSTEKNSRQETLKDQEQEVNEVLAGKEIKHVLLGKSHPSASDETVFLLAVFYEEKR